MKFESKFGCGEVVLTKMPNTERRTRHTTKDVYGGNIFKIIGILFMEDGRTEYVCRHSEGMIITFMEVELVGDPSFDQVTGYPPEDE